MAIAVSLHTVDNEATNLSSYDTASITPTSNAIQLIAVITRDPVTITVPTVSGGGMTSWTEEGSGQEIDIGGGGTGNDARINLFRALEASPGSGTITIDYGGDTQRGCAWIVIEATGVATGGTNGADAVRQVVFGGDNTFDGSPSISLAALAGTGSEAVGVFSSVAGAGTGSTLPAEGSGFTDLGGTNATMAPGTAIMGEHQNNVTTVDVTIADEGDDGWLGVAVELVVAGVTHEGVALMTGTGTLVGNAFVEHNAAAVLDAAGTMAASSFVTHNASGAMAGVGALSSVATMTYAAKATMSAVGSLIGAASVTHNAAAAASSVGSMVANSSVIHNAKGVMAGTGTMVAAGTTSLSAIVSMLGAGSMAAAANVNHSAKLAATGVGTMTANGFSTISGILNITSEASIVAIGQRTRLSTSSLSGAGTMLANAFLTASGKASAISEATMSAAGSIVGQVFSPWLILKRRRK